MIKPATASTFLVDLTIDKFNKLKISLVPCLRCNLDSFSHKFRNISASNYQENPEYLLNKPWEVLLTFRCFNPHLRLYIDSKNYYLIRHNKKCWISKYTLKWREDEKEIHRFESHDTPMPTMSLNEILSKQNQKQPQTNTYNQIPESGHCKNFTQKGHDYAEISDLEEKGEKRTKCRTW